MQLRRYVENTNSIDIWNVLLLVQSALFPTTILLGLVTTPF